MYRYMNVYSPLRSRWSTILSELLSNKKSSDFISVRLKTSTNERLYSYLKYVVLRYSTTNNTHQSVCSPNASYPVLHWKRSLHSPNRWLYLVIGDLYKPTIKTTRMMSRYCARIMFKMLAMENVRIELTAFCLQSRRSPNWANPPKNTECRIWTYDPSLPKRVRYQTTPIPCNKITIFHRSS